MNLNSMKVAELRKELEDRGIDNVKSLKKAELIEKLQEVLDNEALEAEVYYFDLQINKDNLYSKQI